MATRTISNTGGNWDSTSTWVEGVVPNIDDLVTALSTSGQLTVNVANAQCRDFSIFNYVNTFTISASCQLYCTSNVAIGTSVTLAGTGNMKIGSLSGTLSFRGRPIPFSLEFAGGTKSLSTVTSATQYLNNDLRLSGTTILNGSTLRVTGSIVSVTDPNNYASQKVQGTTVITMTGTGSIGNVSMSSNFTINTTGTITFTAGTTFYHYYYSTTRTLTYTAGTVVVGAGHNLIFATAGTNVNLAGITWDNLYSTSDATTTGTSATRFTGSITCNNFYFYNDTVKGINSYVDPNKTLTVNTSMTMYGYGGILTFSGFNGLGYIDYKGTVANMKIAGVQFNNLTATNRLYNFNGSKGASQVNNIVVVYPVDFLSAGMSITHL